jgi:hypothetical protein
VLFAQSERTAVRSLDHPNVIAWQSNISAAFCENQAATKKPDMALIRPADNLIKIHSTNKHVSNARIDES